MALISNDSPCAVCGEKLTDEAYFATSGLGFDRDDPLWRFCDAGIHWRCFAQWPERTRFAGGYYEASLRGVRSNVYSILVKEAKNWFVSFQPRESKTNLYCRATCAPVTFTAQTWPRSVRELNPFEAELLEVELEHFQQHFPIWPMLTLTLDLAAFQSGIEAHEEREERRRDTAIRERQAALAPYQEKCRDMARHLSAGALYCPHCATAHSSIRFYDRSPDGKSFFICQVCKQSFPPRLTINGNTKFIPENIGWQEVVYTSLARSKKRRSL